LLTQLVYPLLYYSYVGSHGQVMIIIATIVTTIRNLALVALTVEACWMAWRMLGASVSDRSAMTRRD
jgi:heme/copper-type cytochrome/quinol oxidase subunit 1